MVSREFHSGLAKALPEAKPVSPQMQRTIIFMARDHEIHPILVTQWILIERAELMYHEYFPGLPYAFCSIIVLYVEDRGRCMYAGYTHVREILEP